MSEVLRTYARPNSRRSWGSGRPRRHWWLFPLVIVLALVWMTWVTRDTHPLGRLIPADQAYQVYVGELLKQRTVIAQSQIWQVLPAESPLAGIPEQLLDNFGAPEWVTNNVIHGLCHVSGTDLNGFSDALFVTHMTRIGCFVERFHRFIPGIADDEAGGLDLRWLPEPNVFYAVRGRVLAVSRSRTALIHALTLTEEDALGQEALEQGAQESGGAEIAGSFIPRGGDPLGDVFESVRVAVHVEPTALRCSCRGALKPLWRHRLAGLLEGTGPKELKMPPDGLLVLSADFGKTLPQFWSGFAQALQQETLLQHTFAFPAGQDRPHEIARSLLTALGTGWRLSWKGVDLNAMLPMPEVVATFDADTTILQTLFALMPPPAGDLSEYELTPRYDADKGIAYLPLIGGPSIEPTGALYGGDFLFSSSRTVTEALIAQPGKAETVAEPGNLYVRLHPYPSLRLAVDTGLEFAAFGALRGYTAQSLEAAAAPWLSVASKVHQVTALAGHQDGEIDLDLRLIVAASAPDAA